MLTLAHEGSRERFKIVEGAEVVLIDRANDHVLCIFLQTWSFLQQAYSPPRLCHPYQPRPHVRNSIVVEPSAPLSPHLLFTTIHSDDAEEESPEMYARPHDRAYACCSYPEGVDPLPRTTLCMSYLYAEEAGG